MANFNYNKVLLGGRLTADVELKQTPSGTSVANFSVAVNRRFPKEGQPDCDFINCVAFGKSAELVSRYFSKGSSIFAEGEMQIRTWTDNSGQKRYATEVIVSEVRFVDSKGESAETIPQSAEPTAPFTKRSQGYIPGAYTSAPAPQFEDISGEDDLPF